MSWLRRFPDSLLQEIAGQPDAIRRAADGLASQSAELSDMRPMSPAVGPLLFTGMGSSYDACYPAVTYLAGRGIAAMMSDAAEVLHFRREILGPDSTVVLASQSGESVELVRLATELRNAGTPPGCVVSVTNGMTNSLSGLSSVSLDTRAGKETGPSTMTFASTLVILAAVGRVLSGNEPDAAIASTSADAEMAASAMEALLGDPEIDGRSHAEYFEGCSSIVLLGRGSSRAAAEMGALMLKETVGVAAEALESAQFRHGPLEIAGPSLGAVVFATEPATQELDMRLARDLSATGASVLLIGPPDQYVSFPARRVFVEALPRTLGPACEIVPVQVLAWGMAVARGRLPGTFTRASKVTVHE